MKIRGPRWDFNFLKANWTLFKESLAHIDPDQVPGDIDDLNDFITNEILIAAKKSIPEKAYRPFSFTLPKSILKLIQKRNKARKKWARKKTKENKKEFNYLSR